MPPPGYWVHNKHHHHLGAWLGKALRVTMRSTMDEVPLPMAGRGQCPNRTRARCLFTGELQRKMSLPACNVLVVLLRRRCSYEEARAPCCGASPPSPPICFGVSPGRLSPDGLPASRLSRLVSVCVMCGSAERFSEVINIIIGSKSALNRGVAVPHS